jgi:uncharacterized RDD family membrane protein YckC
MSITAESAVGATALPTTLEQDVPYVGLLTRVLSWALDLLVINLVAIFTGLGVELVVQIFPIAKHLQPVFGAVAGAVYILWTAAYFVAFWSTTGQTPGARLMQVRLVTPDGGKVRPARALVRYIGMNVGMLPLPWGYLPIPFKRLGFPDWLAHTRVIEAPQLSLAAQRQAKLQEARDGQRATAQPVRER